jgi:hypothetical protein
MTRAYDLFESIRTGGFAAVDQMVKDEVTEELFLDYKRSATTHPSHKLDDQDRKNFSKAISGFGNSDGGIVIWGVDCRSERDRGDVPTGVHLIANVVWFKSLLDGVISGLTLPAHGSVENLAVPQSDSGPGIVVSYVPAGINVPLQSAPVANSVYYMRAGSSFLPVPHGVLAGMFGRQPYPVLKGSFLPAPLMAASGQPHARIELAVNIMNQGRGVADDVHVTIDTNVPAQAVLSLGHVNGDQWSVRIESSRNRWTFASRPSFPRVIPDERVAIATFSIKLTRYPKSDLAMIGTCGSRDSAGSAFEYHLSASQLDRITELVIGNHVDDTHKASCVGEAMSIMKHELWR